MDQEGEIESASVKMAEESNFQNLRNAFLERGDDNIDHRHLWSAALHILVMAAPLP
jgi:hypothetical protein